MESNANTRLSGGVNGMLDRVSVVDLARLRAESDAAAKAASSPGAVSDSDAGEPVTVLRDRNLRMWVTLLVGAVVLLCIGLADLYAAASRPDPAHSVIGSEQ